MMQLVEELRRPLAARGFNLLWPLSGEAFDRACAPVAPALTLRSLLPQAATAVIVASGGRDLFARFRAAPEAADGQPDPLDRFTRGAVGAAVGEALDGSDGSADGTGGYRLFFPFVGGLGSAPALPFQRLGRAAGLGAPGPLGLQIHPHYGPWWAYRALIAFAGDPGTAAAETSSESRADSPGDGCARCDAPCVAACPGGAVHLGGFSIAACHAHRLAAAECQLSCVARIRCVRGPAQRYTDEQLAFHMAASLPVATPVTIRGSRP